MMMTTMMDRGCLNTAEDQWNNKCCHPSSKTKPLSNTSDIRHPPPRLLLQMVHSTLILNDSIPRNMILVLLPGMLRGEQAQI